MREPGATAVPDGKKGCRAEGTKMRLTIKRVADMVGMTPRTLRYYEECGLLKPPRRTSGNYRVYEAEDVARLLRIRRLTHLGFGLHQVGIILSDPASEESAAALKELKGQLEEQLKKLRGKRRAVMEILESRAQLDVVTDFAEVVKNLREKYPDATEAELDKLRIELVVGIGDEEDVARVKEQMEKMVTDEPVFVKLRELDAVFSQLGPDSTDAELEELICGYADALFEMYIRLEQFPFNKRTENLVNEFNKQVYNDAQVFVITEVKNEVEKRLEGS